MQTSDDRLDAKVTELARLEQLRQLIDRLPEEVDRTIFHSRYIDGRTVIA